MTQLLQSLSISSLTYFDVRDHLHNKKDSGGGRIVCFLLKRHIFNIPHMFENLNQHLLCCNSFEFNLKSCRFYLLHPSNIGHWFLSLPALHCRFHLALSQCFSCSQRSARSSSCRHTCFPSWTPLSRRTSLHRPRSCRPQTAGCARRSWVSSASLWRLSCVQPCRRSAQSAQPVWLCVPGLRLLPWLLASWDRRREGVRKGRTAGRGDRLRRRLRVLAEDCDNKRKEEEIYHIEQLHI